MLLEGVFPFSNQLYSYFSLGVTTSTLQDENFVTTATNLALELVEVLEEAMLVHHPCILLLGASLPTLLNVLLAGLLMDIGLHPVVGPGMVLGRLQLVAWHLQGLKAGIPFNTCGEIGWII